MGQDPISASHILGEFPSGQPPRVVSGPGGSDSIEEIVGFVDGLTAINLNDVIASACNDWVVKDVEDGHWRAPPGYRGN